MSAPSHRLGVAGNPIEHSLSPIIHQGFALALGDNVDYQRYLFDKSSFAQQAGNFFQSGGLGLNVTVPFKQDAQEFADELDPLAQAAGAVNTLVQRDAGIVGYNTDGLGMVRDLQMRHGLTLAGVKVLIIGAGGACRGIIQPLLNAGIEKIWVANRTLSNAEVVVKGFANPARVEALSLEQMFASPPSVELIVNSTSMGLGSEPADLMNRAPQKLVADRLCYDLSYGAQAKFARWASDQGALLSVDGLGMLVEQAAESYSIWFGQRPETDAIYQQLRLSIA